MPLVAHHPLPTFQRLAREGVTVISRAQAVQQDIRELHIGLLNLMPDAALEATERQFLRLVGEANQVAQLYLHPFTLASVERGASAKAHIEAHYARFDTLTKDGLDALIITGANATGRDLSKEPFWGELTAVFDWAAEHVTSTLCSCLATHALLQHAHGEVRQPLGFKRWGVYAHAVSDRAHPLVSGVNTRFDVPHSRWNHISRDTFEAHDMAVLAASDEGEVHLAVSGDGIRQVCFQGHPEYDAITLLKEYRREVARWLDKERSEPPPFPERYFSPRSRAILLEFQRRLATPTNTVGLESFPEALLVPALHNSWHDTAEAIMDNWIGIVYRLTHVERGRPFAEGVNPEAPLTWRARA
ncbi:MAG: homoserine O-succinyltransferase [Pseudomonadota bacterium]